MTEGDLVIVCSQFGEVVDCRIVRDKETGKSKGFGFICYEDQRSTILAVDNLNGANLCGRIVRVDHVEQYKIPREYFEEGKGELYKPTGPDGKGWGEERFQTKEEIQYIESLISCPSEVKISNTEGVLDEDERWEKQFLQLVESKKEEVAETKRKKIEKKKKKKEKKAKKEAKKAKRKLEKKLKEEEQTKEVLNKYLDI